MIQATGFRGRTSENWWDNLKHADDTVLWAESSNNWKWLMKFCEESTRAGLQSNINQTKTMTAEKLHNCMEKSKLENIFYTLVQASIKMKMAANKSENRSLEEQLWKTLKKMGHLRPRPRSYSGIPRYDVQVWKLSEKQWVFWNVLEESFLDCKWDKWILGKTELNSSWLNSCFCNFDHIMRRKTHWERWS